MDQYKVDLGSAIRRLREERGLSQPQLARRARVPQPTVSRIEGGHQKPGADIMVALARAMGVTPDSIYSEAGLLDAPGLRETQEAYRVSELCDTIRDLDDTGLRIMEDIAQVLRKRLGNGRTA